MVRNVIVYSEADIVGRETIEDDGRIWAVIEEALVQRRPRRTGKDKRNHDPYSCRRKEVRNRWQDGTDREDLANVSRRYCEVGQETFPILLVLSFVFVLGIKEVNSWEPVQIRI